MDILRSGLLVCTVDIDESTELVKVLMGVDIIKAKFKSNVVLDIRTGDYVTFKGVNYSVNQLPLVTKYSTREFSYDVTFEGYQYAISEAAFLNNGRSDFSLYTNLDTMLLAISANLTRIGITEWTITNNASPTIFMDMAFSADNCLSALQKIARQFEVEWHVVGHEIRVVDKVGNVTGLSFQYKVGLKEITRINANRNNLITCLWAYGGTQNIPVTYRSGILRLSLGAALQNNVATYGYKEGVLIWDDIYPQRTGTITSANGLTFVDTGMDFDLNSYIVPGVLPKIVFKTGILAGYLFDMNTYDHLTTTFQILPYDDPAGFSLPNLTQAIAPGDTYTIVDCYMPESYITAAEAALQEKAEEQLALLSVPRVTYKIKPDWRNFKLLEVELEVGDQITMIDAELNPDGITSRIVQLEQVIVNPYKYVITVSDTVTYSIIENVVSEQNNITNIIKIGHLGSAMRQRANWMNSQEMLDQMFDPDGYLDPIRIRPLSIETGMLSVGFMGSQFILRDVLFEANHENNVNAIHISDGYLDHLTIDPLGVKTWAIGELVRQDLSELTGYYIYVRASTTLLTSDWLVTVTQYQTNPGGGYYYFLVGYLHTPIDGVRGITFMYGQTTINGQFIRTGRITSSDGETYFDLNTGEIHGTIVFESGRTASELEEIFNHAVEGTGEATQTMIDGGIITTGRIEVGSGVLGQGNAGITGFVSGSPATDVRFWAGTNYTNRANAPFRVLNNGTIICTIGQIGGWNIASDAIYTGTKSLVDGKNPNPTGITFGADGSIHAPTWYMDSDGVVGFEAVEKINCVPVTTGSFRGSVNIEGNEIWENTQDSNLFGVIKINYNGYLKGTTRNRVTIIGNGQGESVVVTSGIDYDPYGLHKGLDVRMGSVKVPQHTMFSKLLLSASPGMIIYNSTYDQFEGYTNGGWVKL